MKTLKTLFKDITIRHKIIFTLGMLFLFRILSFLPVPFINRDVLRTISDNGLFVYVSTFTGGALANFTIMATGISAYISASIIIQLLTYAIQGLHDISKSPGGDKVIKRYTIIVGVVMAFFISLGTTITMQKSYSILLNTSWFVFIFIAIIHCIGTGLAIWIGETITDKGFGNGVSLLIFVNIASSLPNLLTGTINDVIANRLSVVMAIVIAVVFIVVLLAIIVSETSQRKIPLQYSRASARSSTIFGNKQSYLPIKLNLTGVMPIIFATTVMQVFSFIGNYTSGTVRDIFVNYLSYGTIPYAVIMAVLIFVFSYFYSALIFDPREIADNIQVNGGCIPGIRPGKPTSEYIYQINKNLTFVGAAYLSLIALIPMIIFSLIGFNGIATTSMMILVGVSLETCQKMQTEAQSRTFNTF